MKLNKRGIIWQELFPWIVGFIILVIILIAYFFITGKAQGAIEYFKTLWRFGR